MRIATGVGGLDKLVGGGFPQGHMVLVSGSCGTGKTIFGLQFLCNSTDKSMFVSFEEEENALRDVCKNFKWPNAAVIIRYDPYKLEDILEILENNIRESGAKRIVIDSISALGIYMRDPAELRRIVLQMKGVFKKHSCTSLIISESLGEESLSRFGVEEFVCDGVIRLSRVESAGSYRNRLSVIKMRYSEHSDRVHYYKITEKGIVIS